jgi:hypothetical protein
MAKEITPAIPAGFLVALDGDNYQTIGERLDPENPLVKAEKVFHANSENAIYPGSLVKLDADA